MPSAPSDIPAAVGYLVEFKSFSGEISPKELAITLCAFANTEGGTVYIGVTDSGVRKGVRITPQLLDSVQNAAREGCIPPVPIELSQIPTDAGKHILRVATVKTAQLHSVAAGQSYIRIGTQDKRVLGDELLRLAETKSQVSFEDKPLAAGLEVIDRDALQEYYVARRSVSSLGERLTPEQLLAKLGLADNEEKTFSIRAAAFILFGRGESDLLLQREFTFVRYDHPGDMYAYREEVRLPATKMLDRLMELIRPHNQVPPRIQGLRRTTDFHYPEAALREGLLNAFAHRDYRMSGLRNECRLYPDRLEIRSAGGFPSFVTLETLGSRHYSRNPKIMHALLILGLVEELGQGISLMRKALAENGNPAPEFNVSMDHVCVTFRKPQPRTATALRERVEAHLATHERITRRQIEALTGLSGTTAKKLIVKLIADGLLVKHGAARSTHYRKAKA